MFKFFALICFFILGLFFSSCNYDEKNSIMVDESLCYETQRHVFYDYSAFDFMSSLNAVVVQWGDRVEYLDSSGYDAYAVKFIRVYDCTVSNSNLGNLGDKLVSVSLLDIAEEYDDVFLINGGDASRTKKGSISLVFVDDSKYAHVRRLDYMLCSFEMIDGELSSTESFDHFAFMRSNYEIKEINQALPIFENGITMDDLGIYFDLATKKETYD